MNLEEPRRVGITFLPAGDHPNDPGLLLGRQLRQAPANPPLAAGRFEPGPRAFPQHRAFKFRERPDHLHHHASRWGR
jgi:hypothetical protein